MPTICVFGDSIAYGAWDPDKGGWVSRLRGFFESESEDYFKIYNLGVPSNTTEDLLLRFENESQARKPDQIIFAIGINDSRYLKTQDNLNVPLEKFQENLETLVIQARKFTAKIIFLGLTLVDEAKTMPVAWHQDNFYSNESGAKYNEAIRKTAEKFDLPFIDLKDKLEISDLDDGLHPNSVGHEKIFQAVKESLTSDPANTNVG